MPARNVILTERQKGLIEALVRSRRYQSASEVLREGLRLVEAREVEEAAKLEALRPAAAAGVAAFEHGQFWEFAGAPEGRLSHGAERQGGSQRGLAADLTQ